MLGQEFNLANPLEQTACSKNLLTYTEISIGLKACLAVGRNMDAKLSTLKMVSIVKNSCSKSFILQEKLVIFMAVMGLMMNIMLSFI